MKTYLWSLVLLFLLASCSQDPTTGTTVVSGQVVENQTRQPVANAQVQVYHLSAGGGYRPVGTPYPADGQGRFAFTFDAESTSGYLLLASAPPGYFTEWALAPSLKAGHKNTDLLIPTYAPAWVKLQLVDEPPKSRVVITSNGYTGSGDTFYYPKDTVVVRPTLAGFKPTITWWIDEQGQTRKNSTYVQPGPLDTITVRIPF